MAVAHTTNRGLIGFVEPRRGTIMSAEDEIRHEVSGGEGGRTLGEAANRWVTFQIVMTIVGLILALLVFVFFFLPIFGIVFAGFSGAP
jgi:hypothetical protein